MEDHHDSYILGDVMIRFADAGYELVSVVIDGWDFTEDMYKHVKWLSNIVPLFEALCDDRGGNCDHRNRGYRCRHLDLRRIYKA